MAVDLESLARAEYVLLTTFRKDGTAVGTPVWVARDGGELAVWTVTDSWKVKRLRRNPAVLVRACDFRGKPKGAEAGGKARVLDAEATERVRALLSAKYGIKGRLAMMASKLRRGRTGTVGIAVALD